ncbi:AraC family transcriptional regulator [Shigella sonnei]|nr:AraC family transcriptional regulator [Shigella sonnei]
MLCLRELNRLELLTANFTDHKFDVHWHDTWSIGVVMTGANNNSADGADEGIIQSGQISLIAPYQLHAGTVLGDERCQYFMFYPSNDCVIGTAEAMDISRLPLTGGKCTDENFLHTLKKTKMVLSSNATILEKENQWNECLVHFIEILSANNRAPHDNLHAPISPGLLRARDFIHAHVMVDLKLDDIASAAGLSKYHLCRQFAANFGMTPARYHRQLRLQQARQLIIRKQDITDIAFMCGFSDHSHLGRLFKASYGMSPGAYRDAFMYPCDIRFS